MSYNEKTNTVRNDWNNLQQFGINYLTAEADGLSLRALCDVNADGLFLLNMYWQVELKLPAPMSREVFNQPSVGCILLPHHGFIVPFGIFALLHEYDLVVAPFTYEWATGLTFEEYEERFPRDKEGYRNNPYRTFEKGGDALGGFRNRHQMSGRVI